MLMLFYLRGWKRTQSENESKGHEPDTKISIIVPVRNEEKNISNILNCLSKQTYPSDKFEIIVIDDFSEDTTIERIKKANIPNLKLLRLESGGGKKQAISEGIKTASGKLIITTDADCEMEDDWMRSIALFYEKEKAKMIISPVLLIGESVFSEKIQSQEMTVLSASACASLYYSYPILCSGANLAYEKEVFDQVNGFEGIDKTATGDDVFLMLKIHSRFPKSIKYLKSNKAKVYTHLEKKLNAVMSQRKRWASKTFSYGMSYITWIAILVFLMNFLVLVSGILCAINVKFACALVTSFFAKCLVDFMLLQSASSFFRKKTYPVSFLIASIVYPVYITIIGLIAPFTNYSWKGRQS